jgi:hypothetical protein
MIYMSLNLKVFYYLEEITPYFTDNPSPPDIRIGMRDAAPKNKFGPKRRGTGRNA